MVNTTHAPKLYIKRYLHIELAKYAYMINKSKLNKEI